MAFTLKIQKVDKKDGTKDFRFENMVKNCGMKFGSDNEFFVLEEGEQKQSTAILYNPERIGRGIYFESNELSEGTITVSYSIPTTAAEIKDFVNVVREIAGQLGDVTMYCEEEDKEYTVESLEANIEKMIQFSLKNLHAFCNNSEYDQFILTLARFPWYMDDAKRTLYKKCEALDDFEQTIHDLQNNNYHFVTPALYRSREDEAILGVYTFTDDCECVLPIDPTECVNTDNFTIERGLIRFFISSDNKLLDGVYPYEQFMDYVMEKEAYQFDEKHVIVPPIPKEEILNFIDLVQE